MSVAPLPPLALYVHLPWCLRKCPYCDFNSYRVPDALPERDYLDAVLRDLELERPAIAARPVTSVFIGGGTPSLFSGAAIERLLGGIRSSLTLAPDGEVTLEANPGAIEAARFAEFRAAGVNRLSIGVQSFRDAMLARLGRVHDSAAAARACAAAAAAGFDNVNLDLMYGLPGDDPNGAAVDLERAIELGPTHISWYQLTIEPGTVFDRQRPELPDETIIAAIETLGRDLLRESGFERYEVSAYARRGYRCAHNLNYWRFGDYLGIGAGAHTKLTGPTGGIVRRMKRRNPRTYIAQAGGPAVVEDEHSVSGPPVGLEYLMNGLRLVEGTDVLDFEARTGLQRESIAAARVEAERRDWLVHDPMRLAATNAGFEHLNRILALFV